MHVGPVNNSSTSTTGYWVRFSTNFLWIPDTLWWWRASSAFPQAGIPRSYRGGRGLEAQCSRHHSLQCWLGGCDGWAGSGADPEGIYPWGKRCILQDTIPAPHSCEWEGKEVTEGQQEFVYWEEGKGEALEEVEGETLEKHLYLRMMNISLWKTVMGIQCDWQQFDFTPICIILCTRMI